MSQYLDWKVGDFVVCVKNLSHAAKNSEKMPELGKVYTIRGLVPTANGCGVGIFLVEIINEPKTYRQGFVECNFSALVFRKLHRNKISVFTDMLKEIKNNA